MNINQIKPMPGKIIVKKLPDDMMTRSGILLTHAANERHEYVEIIKVGKNVECDLIKEGSHGLVMGKGIYDTVNIDSDTYYILNPVDIYAIVED